MKKILIAGDIMQHDKQLAYFAKLISEKHSIEVIANKLFSEELIEYLKSTDVVIGNLETLIDYDEKLHGYPFFNASSKFLDVLRFIGFTDLIVTNNHSKDLSYRSWLNTICAIYGSGMQPHGFEKYNLRTLKNCSTILVNAASHRFNKEFDDENDVPILQDYRPISVEEMMFSFNLSKQLEDDKSLCRLNYIHAGKEYSTKYSTDQIEILKFIESNQTKQDIATIFSHSHVIGEDFERSNDKMKIESGLGNFCSMQKDLDLQRGSILEYSYNELNRSLIFEKIQTVETYEYDNNCIQTSFA